MWETGRRHSKTEQVPSLLGKKRGEDWQVQGALIPRRIDTVVDKLYSSTRRRHNIPVRRRDCRHLLLVSTVRSRTKICG